MIEWEKVLDWWWEVRMGLCMLLQGRALIDPSEGKRKRK